ncbi:ExeM/NucH family extracellular endonuclease [Mariniblastus fucicola]|uniref:Endonuclease/Exonuclease/phosphatase family protein n=1 Tax=Mariniblastus fucicola TaxID=980251 RepID=A0A5B9PH74_9BACT|nr:ExeM/NucH family extracellular endonuclease [Mariniblastus fucicola]QEG22211.1 Endonuclease/Exonuclease/phosphatase family protein [Mariniblastus fucicola]
MTLTKAIARTNFLAMMTIGLLILTIGLLIQFASHSSANAETNGSNDVAVANHANLQPATTKQRSDNKPVVIEGDLSAIDWRSHVGKKVVIKGELVVVDTYDLARRGQIKVARERLYIPTSQIDPNDSDPAENSFEGGSNVAKVVAAQKFNDNAIITIDDGTPKENIFPPTLFPRLGKSIPTVRIGSKITGVTGKLVKAGNNLLLVPSKRFRFTPAERPERPNVGKANVTVASFNVLNYFTTIDNGRNNARGADSKSEFKRQEAKLVSAIIGLGADVIGLMELENNLESEKQLVAALNKEIGSEVFKACGLPDGFDAAPGGENAIRVGIIYRSDRVSPVGEVSMVSDVAFDGARTPIVQSFKPNRGSEKSFSLIVNHFKSKGGSDRADVANKNKGDGQGAYNATRRAQSLAICNYIDAMKQDDAEARVLVVGDLNAYGQEDPVDAMRAKGLVDLRERSASGAGDGERDYSYIYYGQSGNLDHAMATESLANDVTGIATWHINSDEPRFLDYNQEYNPKPLYEADPFRSSDHDPVLIGIGN